MLIPLFVLLVLCIAMAVLLDREFFVVPQENCLRFATPSGLAPTEGQYLNRVMLRNVVWFWRYGYYPPKDMTPSQRLVFGAINALALWSVTAILYALILRGLEWLMR